MKRIGTAGLALVAVIALTRVAAAVAAPACLKVDSQGEAGSFQYGTFEDAHCEKALEKGDYIRAELVSGEELRPGLWCAKAASGEPGFYKNASCSQENTKGEYVRVVVPSGGEGPLFSLCHKVPTEKNFGTFEDSGCSKEKREGAYVLGYADDSSALWLCVKKEPGLYTDAFCNGFGSGSFEQESKREATPELLGVSLDTATLKSSVAGVGATISCVNGTFKAQPEENGALSEGKLEYTGCRAPKPVGCTVKEPIIGTFNGQLLAADKVLFIGNKIAEDTAKSPETFVEITYENNSSCLVKNQTFPVHGQQYCEGAVGISTLKSSQTLICKATGSSLKLGGEPATYENEVGLDATSKEDWAVLSVSP